MSAESGFMGKDMRFELKSQNLIIAAAAHILMLLGSVFWAGYYVRNQVSSEIEQLLDKERERSTLIFARKDDFIRTEVRLETLISNVEKMSLKFDMMLEEIKSYQQDHTVPKSRSRGR